MSRHPYTYAADFVRHYGGYNERGTRLSRSDASRIISAIADEIGLTKEELSIKLSEAYVAKENTLTSEGTRNAAEAIWDKAFIDDN